MLESVSPTLFVAGAFALAIMITVCALSLKGCAAAIAGLIAVAAIDRPVNYRGVLQQQWIEPIQAKRSEIFLALGIALTIGYFAHKSKRVRGAAAPHALLLIGASILAALLRVVHGDPVDGVLSLALLMSCMVVLLPIMARLLEDAESARFLMRCFSLALAAWCCASIVQWLIDPRQLFASGRDRFLGVAPNPQHAATFLAFTTGISVWLGLNDPKKFWRVLCGGIALVGLGMLLMTLSRTGMMILLAMAVPVFASRMGRTVIFLPLLAGAGGVAAAVVGSVTGGGFGRLLSTEDTRSAVWRQLIGLFIENPLIGVGPYYKYDKVASENSLLVGLATYGLAMGILVVLIWIALGLQTLAIWKARPQLRPEHQRIAELVVGFNLALGAGSIFEGYFVGRIHTALIFACVFGSLGAWILMRAKEPMFVAAPSGSEGTPKPVVESGSRRNWGELLPG